MRNKIILFAMLLSTSSIAISAQAVGPEEAVKAFYLYSNARSSTFNSRHIESRKQWYTPSLYRAFRSQLAKDRAHVKANPTDKPFFGDGLDFKPVDEPCEANGRSYRRTQSVSRRDIRKTRAFIDVKFAYPKACDIEPEHYRVGLRKINGKWLIDDWTYSSGMTLRREMRENKY
jgi:hypothetical protein